MAAVSFALQHSHVWNMLSCISVVRVYNAEDKALIQASLMFPHFWASLENLTIVRRTNGSVSR